MRSLLLIMASAVSTSADADAVWQQAVDSFEKGKATLARREEAKTHFEQAVARFTELQRAGIRHPALFRNLGNAHSLADNLPEAILAYRQGLLLDPRDASIREALHLARAQVLRVDETHGRAEQESWPSWLPWPGFGVLLSVSLTAWAAACITGWRAWRSRSPQLIALATCLLVPAIVGGLTWKSRADLANADNLVVVRDDAVALRRGNGPHFAVHPELPVLRRGMEARRLHERGGWMQIRFASGEVGWVPHEAIATTR
ncbi:MAG: hypothetical protein K2X38_13580 [Gemmataceae bacterium]|nr:hypothetical protein [Gemmataceae bacterium]